MRKKVNKIEEIVEFLYIRELVGETLYDDLHTYPTLKYECEQLSYMAVEYESAILSKQPSQHLKSPIIEKILYIHNICLGIEKYRVSNIFFDENLELIDLI